MGNKIITRGYYLSQIKMAYMLGNIWETSYNIFFLLPFCYLQ